MSSIQYEDKDCTKKITVALLNKKYQDIISRQVELVKQTYVGSNGNMLSMALEQIFKDAGIVLEFKQPSQSDDDETVEDPEEIVEEIIIPTTTEDDDVTARTLYYESSTGPFFSTFETMTFTETMSQTQTTTPTTSHVSKKPTEPEAPKVTPKPKPKKKHQPKRKPKSKPKDEFEKYKNPHAKCINGKTTYLEASTKHMHSGAYMEIDFPVSNDQTQLTNMNFEQLVSDENVKRYFFYKYSKPYVTCNMCIQDLSSMKEIYVVQKVKNSTDLLEIASQSLYNDMPGSFYADCISKISKHKKFYYYASTDCSGSLLEFHNGIATTIVHGFPNWAISLVVLAAMLFFLSTFLVFRKTGKYSAKNRNPTSPVSC